MAVASMVSFLVPRAESAGSAATTSNANTRKPVSVHVRYELFNLLVCGIAFFSLATVWIRSPGISFLSHRISEQNCQNEQGIAMYSRAREQILAEASAS